MARDRIANGATCVGDGVQAWLDGYHLMQALEDGQAFLEAAIEAEQDGIKAASLLFEHANDPDTARDAEAIGHQHRGAQEAYQRVLESVAIVKRPQAPAWRDQTQADPLTFAELRKTNVARCEDVFWKLHDRAPDRYAAKLAEEGGEVIRASNRIAEFRETRFDNLAEEAADCIIVADLLLARIGRDTAAEVRKKFDAVSAKKGSAITLPDARRELRMAPVHKTGLAILERFKAHCASVASIADDVHGVAFFAGDSVKNIDVAAWLAQDEAAQNLAAMAAEGGARE